MRVVELLRGSALAPEFARVESIAGRAKGTLTLVGTGGGFRQTYDVTSLDARIRRSDVPLPIAIDGGGLRYETGGALVLRGMTGTVGTSRFEQLDAEIAFAPGPTVRSASGTATLALDELFPWVLSLPAARELRGDLTSLDGSVGVKLTRLAGPLADLGRLEMEADAHPAESARDDARTAGQAHDGRRDRPPCESGSRGGWRRRRDAGPAQYRVGFDPWLRDARADVRYRRRARHDRSARTRVGGKRGGTREWRTLAGAHQNRPRTGAMARARAVAVRHRGSGVRSGPARARKSI